ncbi:MAG: aminotransferase class V-fold PLP-dependent enzyme [Candidatus Aminicenantes bacterium]|nr:aminotransferase class V-fold PLP-dependent enzyme [Candidatus Aminicenantes bacterium]
MPNSRSIGRREAFRRLFAGSAVSAAVLAEANAGVYQAIASLNRKYPEDDAPDGRYWEAVAGQFLFEDDLVMMNNGTVGPMPRPVFNTFVRVARLQASHPYDVYNFLPGQREEIRAKAAAFIGASPDELALTSNTTEGLNFVLNGLDFKAGDEILISDLEHPGMLGPLKLREKRSGIVVKQAKLGLAARSVEAVVEAFSAEVTPRTKLIALSHTIFITGLITPVKELCRMAHEKGVPVLADSAHGAGMMHLDMKSLGVDFWASSPYKWMGSPTGIGLLFVRRDVQDKLWPTVVSSGWDAASGARKFDPSGQRLEAMVHALGEAVDFQNRIGRDRIERRIKVLAARLKQGLGKIPGARIHTPLDPYLSAGLTVFSLEGVEAAKIVDYVREKYNLVVRTVGNREAGTYGIRVSTPIFVSTAHVDRLLEGVEHLARRRV